MCGREGLGPSQADTGCAVALTCDEVGQQGLQLVVRYSHVSAPQLPRRGPGPQLLEVPCLPGRIGKQPETRTGHEREYSNDK